MSEGYDWEYIRQAIDMDEWKHSWHLPKEDYEARRKRVREILIDKITDREADLLVLHKALGMYGESK